MRERWSDKRSQSSRKQPRAKSEPSRWRARRTVMWPRCATKTLLRTLGWRWMGWPFHGTPPSGSSRKGMPTI